MPSSPLQFVNARTQPLLPPPDFLRRGRQRRRPISAALSQQRPGDPRHVVGKRHRHHFERFASEKVCQPGILLRSMARVAQHRVGSDHQNAPQIAISPFRDRPKLMFATGESSRGTIPIQAAKSRPNRKTFGSATAAAIALAPVTPMPGMLSSRRLTSLERCCTMIRCRCSDHRLHRLKFRRQHGKARMSIGRQARILCAGNDLRRLLNSFTPLRSHNVKLSQMRP